MGWLCSGIGRLNGNVRAKLRLSVNNLTKPIDEIAAAYHAAFTMPLEERRARHAASMEVVRQTDAALWADRFLASLRSCVPTLGASFGGLSSAGRPGGGANRKVEEPIK